MKLKTIYKCIACGLESPKWIGKCSSCNGWNTFTENIINVGKKEETLDSIVRPNIETVRISTKERPKGRIPTGFTEVDNVIGGGFTVGSIVLLGGDPGIGQ